MCSGTRVVRVYPEVRSAHLERHRSSPRATTLYLRERGDFDRGLDTTSFRRVNRWSAAWRAARSRPDVLEVPEPLWLEHAPWTFAVAIWCRAAARLEGRPLRVAAYAIDNSGPDRVPRGLRSVPPALWRLAARTAARLAARPLDRLAFGTDGARDAYLRVVGERWASRRRTSSRVIDALPCPCACVDTGRKEQGRVLFLGQLHPRKGFDLVLDAWPAVCEPPADGQLRLVVVGEGPLLARARAAAASDSSIELVGAVDRERVHEELNRACVLILPSQGGGRWREQVGLPIVEGLAHGCHVVTTDETGLADRLRVLGHAVLDRATSADLLPVAVRSAATHHLDPAAVLAALPEADGRLLADEWLTS